MPLLVESAASEPLQKLVANICGQLRLRGRDIRNRLVYSFVYGVARKAWVSPVCGPLSTVAIPAICPRSSVFTWEVRDNGHLTAKKVYPHPKLATGSPILGRIIEPKASMSTDQEVSRQYDMAKPGEYTIQASREIPKAMGGGVVKSNVITVLITP